MLHIIACLQIVHSLHRLIPTGHEAMTVRRTKGMVTLYPCHVSVTPSDLRPNRLLQETLSIVTVIGVLRLLLSLSALTFFRNTSSGPVLPRGAAVCTATATVNAWTSFSIIYLFCLGPWLLSVGTCIVSSPWIQRSPTFCP